MVNWGDVVSAGDAVSGDRDVLSVLWAITKACNFDCSYCVYKKNIRDAGYTGRDAILGAAEKLMRMGRPGYQITLYRGKPTLHPYFLDLVDHLTTLGPHVKLRMFSNGSLARKVFEDLANRVAGTSFGSIFSFHPEFAKFDRYIQAVEAMASRQLPVMVNYMFSPSLGHQVNEHVETLLELRSKYEFYIELNYTYDTDGVLGKGASADQRAWVDRTRLRLNDLGVNDNHLPSPNFCRVLCTLTTESDGLRTTHDRAASLSLLNYMNVPYYKDFYCCSGSNVYFIEETGDIRGGVCSASADLGNIFRKSEIEIMQAVKPVRCTSPACSSIENIPLPKFKAENEASTCISEFKYRAKSYFYKAEARRLID